MPLYEYRCADCCREFSMLRAISRADDSADCPTCGSDDISRKISLIAAVREPTSTGPTTRSAGGGCCGGCCGCAPRS